MQICDYTTSFISKENIFILYFFCISERKYSGTERDDECWWKTTKEF